MRVKILFFVVTIIVLLSGGWLYTLSVGGADQYQQTFNGYGATPPQITTFLFSILNYWWAILLAVALISYLPLFALKSKWQYASLLTSIACLCLLIGIVYAPIIAMGSVI